MADTQQLRKARPKALPKAKSPVEKPEKTARASDADAQAVVLSLRKKLGTKTSTVVHLLSDQSSLSEVQEWIPTGFADLDRCLGGGWAVGRCSEVFGDEASGKSALAHSAIRECQRRGGLAMLLDYEQALDKKKIRNVGIDETRLVYVAPESMEEGWEAIWAFLDSVKARKLQGPALIVWDSIAAAIPKVELEGKMDEHAVGAHARLMSKGCRKASRAVAKARAHLMWINQYRSKIGGGGWHGGPDKDTTGGRAAKFYSSQRLSCTRIKRIKPSSDAGVPPSGYLILCETQKCRLAPPHRKTEWVLDFVEGPSASLTTQHLLLQAGLVRTRGSGRARVPWQPKDQLVKLRAWAKLWHEDPKFRREAGKALEEIVTAGGTFAYLQARKKVDPDAEGDEDVEGDEPESDSDAD